MQISAEVIVEAIGPCTQNVDDCEIMRAAIALQDAKSSERSNSLREELAKAACTSCRAAYMSDVKIDL